MFERHALDWCLLLNIEVEHHLVIANLKLQSTIYDTIIQIHAEMGTSNARPNWSTE